MTEGGLLGSQHHFYTDISGIPWSISMKVCDLKFIGNHFGLLKVKFQNSRRSHHRYQSLMKVITIGSTWIPSKTKYSKIFFLSFLSQQLALAHFRNASVLAKKKKIVNFRHSMSLSNIKIYVISWMFTKNKKLKNNWKTFCSLVLLEEIDLRFINWRWLLLDFHINLFRK